MIAFRVTRTYEELHAFVERLSTQSSKLIVYQHDASRTHIHGLVVECKVSTDTLKNWIKHELNCDKFPKSDWSFITQDKQGNPVTDAFITYMSKGILQPRYYNGYSEDDIEQYRLKWKPTERTKVQYVLKQENPHEAKKRQNDMIDEIVRRVESEGLKTTEEIINAICKVVYKENRTVMGRYKIRDFYDAVLYRTDQPAFMRQMINLCLKV